MPIYEFKCQQCNHEFEKLCKEVIDKSDCPPCPKCDGSTEKLISESAFHLKGTGWGADGYTSKKKGS